MCNHELLETTDSIKIDVATFVIMNYSAYGNDFGLVFRSLLATKRGYRYLGNTV